MVSKRGDKVLECGTLFALFFAVTEEAKIILELRKENEAVRRENELLRQKVDLLIRRIFGRSSEAMSPEQLELLLGGKEGTPLGKGDASLEEEAYLRQQKESPKRRNPRESWPSDLPVIEEVIEPEEVKEAPEEWRFIGAGERSAILYTIIESCRRRGINPFDYLRDVLIRLPHATNWNVAQLTPENWAKNQKSQQELRRAA